jgi:RNA-directed DNA polymerase
MQTAMSTNGLKKQLEHWHQINWRKMNKAVKNLHQRISLARKLGNWRKLRNLQKLMQRSGSSGITMVILAKSLTGQCLQLFLI